MPEVSIKPASYSFRQLAYWRDQLAAVASKVGARFLDLNERENRVTIGLTRPEVREALDSQLLALSIPREAVTVEESNPTYATENAGLFQSATHQRAYADTLAGGLQYAWYDVLNTTNGFCTIGYTTSTPSGDVGFISAGHCSPQKWTTDGYFGSKIGQPSTTNNIGYELYDPSPGTCPILWGCDHYRFADANLNKITGRPVKVGYLVAPNSRLGSSGVDTTLYANWYIAVTGTTSSISAGSVIDKIGRSTGWHYGTVNNTCSDFSVGSWPDVQMVRCAYSINTAVENGDSGGPVFYYSGGEATAAGITHAKDGPSKAWFSKWMYVESELTGSSPGPASLSIIAPSPPPAPSATIYGPSSIKPNATCYWYVASNFEYTGVEWKVNGSVVGTNYDLYLSRSSSFTLDVTVTDGVRWAQKSLSVNVSSGNSTCAIE
jgi:hypothetical protein